MAVEAVISELVSACPFPVQRENTGKFADLDAKLSCAPAFGTGNSIAYPRNSLATKAGKFCGRIGNFEARNSERAARNWVMLVNAATPDLRTRHLSSYMTASEEREVDR